MIRDNGGRDRGRIRFSRVKFELAGRVCIGPVVDTMMTLVPTAGLGLSPKPSLGVAAFALTVTPEGKSVCVDLGNPATRIYEISEDGFPVELGSDDWDAYCTGGIDRGVKGD